MPSSQRHDLIVAVQGFGDGDGCDNYTEWEFGADPTDSSSYVPAMLTAGVVLLIAALAATATHRHTVKRTADSS